MRENDETQVQHMRFGQVITQAIQLLPASSVDYLGSLGHNFWKETLLKVK